MPDSVAGDGSWYFEQLAFLTSLHFALGSTSRFPTPIRVLVQLVLLLNSRRNSSFLHFRAVDTSVFLAFRLPRSSACGALPPLSLRIVGRRLQIRFNGSSLFFCVL